VHCFRHHPLYVIMNSGQNPSINSWILSISDLILYGSIRCHSSYSSDTYISTVSPGFCLWFLSFCVHCARRNVLQYCRLNLCTKDRSGSIGVFQFLIPDCLNHVIAVPLRYDAAIETILSFLTLLTVHACSNDSNHSIGSWSPAENVGKSTNLDYLGVTSLSLLSLWLILRVIASRASTTNRSRSRGNRLLLFLLLSYIWSSSYSSTFSSSISS